MSHYLFRQVPLIHMQLYLPHVGFPPYPSFLPVLGGEGGVRGPNGKGFKVRDRLEANTDTDR
jgi:hypothetical protein